MLKDSKEVIVTAEFKSFAKTDFNLKKLIHPTWLRENPEFFNSDYFKQLLLYTKNKYEDEAIIEPKIFNDIFYCIKDTSPYSVRAIIIGMGVQDFSNGLLFGVKDYRPEHQNRIGLAHDEWAKPRSFDQTLVHLVDDVLMINPGWFTENKAAHYNAPLFKALNTNLIEIVVANNPNVVVATTNVTAEFIVSHTSVKKENIINANGYLYVKNKPANTTIYSAINDRLEELGEEPIEFTEEFHGV